MSTPAQYLPGLLRLATLQPASNPQLQQAQGALGTAGNVGGIYSGIEQGGVTGYGGAALNAEQLANRAGLTSPATNNYATDLGNLLGMYSGIRQGGVSGDAQAAVNAARLGSNLGAFGGASQAVGDVAGYAAIPLSLYNEVKNWQSGNTGSDALGGASTGAAIGTAVEPGLGTLIGAGLGAVAGGISSAFGPGRMDPETQSVQGLINLVGAHPQYASQITSQVQNPYLQLAGLFDRRSSTLPMYQQYGRMGEQKFTNDMVNQINQAYQKGTINAQSTPQDVYSKVVAPWVAGMGQGWGPVGQTYTQTTQGLLQDMVGQYLSGQAPYAWKAIGGDQPFANLPTYGGAPSTPVSTSMRNPERSRLGANLMSRYGHGGHILDFVRPSFSDYAQHFDGGGGVQYSGYAAYTPQYFGPPPSDSPGTSYFGGPSPSFDTTPTVYGQPPIPSSGGTAPATGGGGAGGSSGPSHNFLSGVPGLGSLLGGLSNSQLGALLGGGVGLLASLGGGNQFSFHPPAPFSGSGPPAPGTNPYGNFSAVPRTQTHPNINWNTYGTTPGEAQFYTPSPQQLSPLQVAAGAAPHPLPAPTGHPIMSTQPIRGSLLAEGGEPGGVHVHGEGDGTSDDIPAMLSAGEYVIPAHIVSALGNGDNDAGARQLDQLQERIRQKVGKQMASGKHPSKVGEPEKYMKEGDT